METLKKNFRRIFMLTGILIFALSISVFAAEVASIGDVKYETLKEAYDNAASGDTITLSTNASGEGIVINKNITIDLGGYTYTFTTPGVGSGTLTSNGFQILCGSQTTPLTAVNNVTIKNGTLNVDESHSGEYYILVQNYANLTLDGVTLDGTNLDKWSTTDGDSYTLSNNCGTVNIIGETNIIANDEGALAYAFDSCEKSSYAVPKVNVATTGKITGKIEVIGNANLAISSGIYTVPVSGDWCAYGFEAVDNGDGTYKVVEKAYVAEVNENKYYTLKDAYDAAEPDSTITLLGNTSGEGIVINKNITIDLGGYTYTFTTPGVGSGTLTSNGFQILCGSQTTPLTAVNNVTIKNGTLNVDELHSGEYYILVQNYANLTLDGVTLDGTNLDKWSTTDGDSYTLSNNCGTVNIIGETNIIANDEGALAYAFDSCEKSSYAVPKVNVATTGKITGKIEVIGNANLAISSGIYTVAIDQLWCAEGYVPVYNGDGTYGVAQKSVDVDTTVEAGDPVVSVPEGMEIESESFTADTAALESVASSLANSEDVVGNSGDAVTALVNNGIISSGDSVEITVVVSPYIDIALVSGDVDSKYLEFNISAKYNVIVTTNSGDMNDTNSVTIGSGDIEDIVSIDITLALPEGFPVNSGDTLYVHHTKEDTGLTYVYEAKVSGDGDYKTITFTNPNGFSKFEVKSENGAVRIGNNVYATLEDAINVVENEQTITLLANNEEQVTVSEDIKFAIDKDVYVFSGDVVAGANTTKTTTEGDTVIVYEFDYTTPASRPSTGGGSSVTTYRITVTQTTGGKISPTSTRVEEGEDQTFTIKANEGYEISDVIVDAMSVGKVSEYTFENVDERHAITAIFVEIGAEEEWENPYIDVSEDDWYFEAVKYVSSNGLFNGMEATVFGPEVTLTRGMLVTILYRLEGEPVTNKSIPFADVDMSKYYAAPIAWAKQNNIVNGIDETNFAPDAEITREQLATILYRYAKAKGMDVSVGENTNILSYDDVSEVSEYAIEALQWACGAGIINGRTESTLVPKGNAKRCEVATMIQRFIEE